MLVYDITDRKSFNDCTNFFISKIEENCWRKQYKILLLGNKTDVECLRQIIPQKGSLFAQEYNCKFMECSCVTNENVFYAFQSLIEITSVIFIDKFKEEKMDDSEESDSKSNEEDAKLEKRINKLPKLMKFLKY